MRHAALLLLFLLAIVSAMASIPAFGCARSCQACISGGGVSATAPVVCRGVCIRNVGNSPFRFSRIGFYKATDDAHDGRTCDVICENKATIRLYTIGITPVRGSAITFDPVPDYNDVSKAHHVTIVPNAALVVDFGLDVSFSVVRLGKVDSFTDPSACRLEMKTGSGYRSIATAAFSTPVFLTFSSGDTQNNAFLNTDGTPIPTSGVFTTSPISFKDATAKAAADAKAVAEKAAADAKAVADKAAADAKAAAEKAAADAKAASTKAPSVTYPPFKLPQNDGGSLGSIRTDGSWITTARGYSGVILDTVFTGEFTFVLSYYFDGDPEYMKASAHLMVVHPSASTTNFVNKTVDWWNPGVVMENFPGYSIGLHHYNYDYGGGRLFPVWSPYTYWQYQRRGNTLTLRNGQTPTGPWNDIKSATVSANDKVICAVAMVYERVHEVRVVSIEPVITKALITGGLVYHFDASIRLPTTSAWTDATTGDTTMTLHNTPTVTSGPVSYVRFNGTNQYGSSLNMAGRSAFSTTVWIRTTSTVDNGTYYMQPCVIGRDAAGPHDFELTIGAGYASIWTGLGPGPDQRIDSKTTANYVADGAWHELTVTSSYAAGTILYVDGVAYGAALAASQVTQPGQTWFVAATNSDYGTAPRCFCAVDISIIALYDRSLSPTEVSTNFTAKRSAFGR
jgi:hypothetical protein